MEAYDKRIALKTILLAQLLIESLDEMKGTTLFRQGTKNLINKVDKELTPLVEEHYNRVYSEDIRGGIDILDQIVEELVHNALIDIEVKEHTNLYCLKDRKTGRIVKIKSPLSVKEFEKEYNVKLGTVTTLK